MISSELTGIEELNLRLRKLEDASFFDALLADTAMALFNSVERKVQKHSKSTGTGALERSLGSGPEKLGDLSYEVKSDGQIAPANIFVHWGTSPHVIRPNKRKALRWVSGNSFMFAKFINHPGYAGDPFMVNAVTDVLRDFDSIVQKFTKDL